MNIRRRLATFWNRQHQYPTGIAGRIVGERMARQHAPETAWTVAQMALGPSDVILELGCGAGRGIARAMDLVPEGLVTGVDISAAMVRAARRRASRAVRSGRVALVRGDAAALPLASHRFDKIFSIHSFYFWPDPIRTIADLMRVLKPGGLLMLVLSTRIIGPEEAFEPGPFGELQTFLEREVIPAMQRMGFASATLIEGPVNRQFNTVAVVGRSRIP